MSAKPGLIKADCKRLGDGAWLIAQWTTVRKSVFVARAVREETP